MSKAKVSLREKKISKGRKSLYLDFYPAIINPKTGKATRREFLRMYIFEKPKNPIDKQHNKETKSLAESIRSKRQLEIQFDEHGFKPKGNLEGDFLKYFRKLTNNRYESQGNYGNWLSTLKQLESYKKNGATFGDVDKDFVEGFKQHLLSNNDIKQNTRVSYYRKFLHSLKSAIKDGHLDNNPAKSVDSLKEESTSREYLTLEELKVLAKTDCKVEIFKSAFLFSALTGLRFSDIQALTWSDLQGNNKDGYFIRFKQKKTGQHETLMIPKSARKLMGERNDNDAPIFKNLIYSAWYNTKLQDWVDDAKINKKITFHCARHSFATLQLTMGTDIYTVSKLLGHKDLKTTEIYGKIIDQKKHDAMNKMDDFEL